jgi:hypothetical protein
LPSVDRMDTPDSMKDEEGNSSMFLGQLHPSSANCDQVTASHEDLDVGQAQQLTDCDTSENTDIDAALNPSSVIPPLERDIDSSSQDLQDTARTRLNDSIALDIDTGQSWDSDRGACGRR